MCGSHDGPQWITCMNLQSLSTWPTWSEDSTPFSDHSVLKIILLLTPLRPAEKKNMVDLLRRNTMFWKRSQRGAAPCHSRLKIHSMVERTVPQNGSGGTQLAFLFCCSRSGFSFLHLDVQVFPGIVLHHSDSHGLPSKKLWSGSLVPINGERIYRFAVYRNIRYIYTSK